MVIEYLKSFNITGRISHWGGAEAQDRNRKKNLIPGNKYPHSRKWISYAKSLLPNELGGVKINIKLNRKHTKHTQTVYFFYQEQI